MRRAFGIYALAHVGEKKLIAIEVFFLKKNAAKLSHHNQHNVVFFCVQNSWIEEFWLSDLGNVSHNPTKRSHGPNSPEMGMQRAVQQKWRVTRMT